jgi:hypothetical protein
MDAESPLYPLQYELKAGTMRWFQTITQRDFLGFDELVDRATK